MKLKVLITGSSGFLAGQLINRLQQCEWVEEVWGIDKKPDLSSAWSREVDVTNTEALQSALREFPPDLVFHLSSPSPKASLEALFATNVTGMHRLLEVLGRQEKRPRVLVVGSAAEYGCVQPDEIPVREDNALRPISYYGLSKAAQTMLCLTEGRRLEIPIIICRPFNIIGPGMPDFLAFGNFARQIAEVERVGEQGTLRVGNLETRRDFIDARDVANALCLLSQTGRDGEVYNICSGTSHSIGEGLKILIGRSSAKIETLKEDSRCRRVEVPDFVGDPSKVEKQTGWRASLSFERSVRDLAESMKERY